MIRIANLSLKYGTQTVLDSVNLKFERGEVHGIVGNNGAGKSTLFRCIAGLESFEGSITSEFSNIKNHLGFLDTTPYFFPKITGEEYLRLICNARKIPDVDLNKRNLFDLPLHKYAEHYSTGMQKKLAITGILLQENDYFILDEPFNGLDMESNIVLTAIILHLKQLNKIILISSHIFSTLTECCDFIHVVKNGSITKSSNSAGFESIEDEMKQLTLGDKIANLGLK